MADEQIADFNAGYTQRPDRKGTERHGTIDFGLNTYEVTLKDPIERGLKAY